MKITRLRALGFKSFVEPAELLIEPGLTGVVGPNGCGKSNLLEAIRWVMGETSFRSMRASGMDDVIFAGTQNRPARNMAEVTLFIDNSNRRAPAEFNDADVLEVTRRIEREAGSTYKINDRDVRARDVRLLFEDATTGARSPALVRQGRIGEIINAKPQERRRILEDAAGITGLHSRRHEAKLRLNASESNLERLEDFEGQYETQLKNLNRQARQARRYTSMSSKIREASALRHHIAWTATCEAVDREEASMQDALLVMGSLTKAEARALTAQAQAAETLPPLREEEARRAASLQRLAVERDVLEEEVARAKARGEELETRIGQMERDASREREIRKEAQETLARLDDEKKGLSGAVGARAEKEEASRASAQARAQELAQAETCLSQATAELAEARAQREQIETRAGDARARIAQLEAGSAEITNQLQTLEGADVDAKSFAALEADVARLAEVLKGSEDEMLEHEITHAARRKSESSARDTTSEAKLHAEQLETEARTLQRILAAADEGAWPPILEALTVKSGYENSVSAALGDDLEAPTASAAPAHWAFAGDSADDPALPEGIEALASFVEAPPELARRLKQIGIVEISDGARLQGELQAGQRLVSRGGDLWRWDGFTASAEAPRNAAQRLAARNRLSDLDRELESARSDALMAEAAFAGAGKAAAQAEAQDKHLRQAWRASQSALDQAREALKQAERRSKDATKQLGALGEAISQNESALGETRQTLSNAEHQLGQLASLAGLEEALERQREAVDAARPAYTRAQAGFDTIERELSLAQTRIEAICDERGRAVRRLENSDDQIATLQDRTDTAHGELVGLAKLPKRAAQRRGRILDEIAKAEAARSQAADTLARAEADLREKDKALREVLGALSEIREDRARAEARLDAARERRGEQVRQVHDALNCSAEDCLAIANLKPGQSLPVLDDIDVKLSRLKAERERLGGVNLRAEEEAKNLESEISSLAREREDLIEAIGRLRQGISRLDREGRKRLLEAFDEVNEHFQKLFQTLFGGGSAELQLIESDDPLESGLEILAQPPGKKPQVLTLLSGGEKALTALALIFAVFLTNPSPICVLDEVDAPLDDANVERFCKLIDEMRQQTDTRFLIITHHPYTMSHVDRLFGVTMVERGISRLVSVDLEMAEELSEIA